MASAIATHFVRLYIAVHLRLFSHTLLQNLKLPPLIAFQVFIGKMINIVLPTFAECFLISGLQKSRLQRK